MAKTNTYFEQVPLENVMEAMLEEFTVFIRGDAQWWDDAARHIEEVASKLADKEKSKWQLVSACYQERAQLHRDWVERLQQS